MNSASVQPSIFQVLSQDNLSFLIEPALTHILKVAAERKPGSFQKYFQHSEELICIARLLLEFYFLKKHSSSFSEYLYSIKRIPLSEAGGQNLGDDSPSTKQLSKTLILKSIFFMVLLPYLKRKLDALHNKDIDDTYRGINKASKSRLRKAFLGIYPYLHATLEGSNLVFQLAYAGGYSRFHSLPVYLSGTRLVSITSEDIKSELLPSWRELFHRGCLQNLRPLSAKLMATFESLTSKVFSASLFFLHFLEWWQTHDIPSSVTALPDPGSPKSLLNPDLDPMVMTLCPLCGNRRVQDTAISVSGFVFCYACIVRHVRSRNQCPVTGYPCTEEHLIKLYLTDS